MYSGMTFGANPIYRGQIPYATQHTMGRVRMVATAAEQIMKSKEVFPADDVNLGMVKAKIVLQEDKDQEFVVWLSKADGENIKITGPDGKGVNFKEEQIFSGESPYKWKKKMIFCKLIVAKDNKAGTYSISKDGYIYHAGSSLKKVAFDLETSDLMGCGVPLYMKSESLGDGVAKFTMRGTPSVSFGLYTLEGKQIFSETYVRPATDNVGIEQEITVPVNSILKTKDRSGIHFDGINSLRVYLNKDGVF